MFLVICKLNKLIGTWDEDSLPGMQEQGKNQYTQKHCLQKFGMHQSKKSPFVQASTASSDRRVFVLLPWRCMKSYCQHHPKTLHKPDEYAQTLGFRRVVGCVLCFCSPSYSDTSCLLQTQNPQMSVFFKDHLLFSTLRTSL